MMLKVTQVAEQLNVSESIVYALINGGQLAHHRIGVGRGTIRVSNEDLEAYLASCRACKSEQHRRPVPRPHLRHIHL